MHELAALYFELDATTSTRAKLDALVRYFSQASPADAAWAAWFLGGARPRQVVPTRVLVGMAVREAGITEWLFAESYDAVGDLAETIAHLLPPPTRESEAAGRTLAEWIENHLLPLRDLRGEALENAVRTAWQSLDGRGRFLWNKLVTGAFRVGVSRLLVTRALGMVAGVPAKLVAERMAGDWQPSPAAYAALIAAEGTAAQPDAGQPYPFFLAHPLAGDPAALGPVDAWQVEWKWDGIRAQLVRRAGRTWLWSRGEELITDRFPEITAAASHLPDGTVIDGEVLAWRGESVLPFAVLQRRTGRKRLDARTLAEAPCVFLAYDLLEWGGEDFRERAMSARRLALESVVAAGDMLSRPTALRLSPLVGGRDWDELARLRERSREAGVEGFMLKHRTSRYGIGRVKQASNGWWKWKIDPLAVDAVLVYAQRGSGRRASLYTDYTFAVWDGDALVPFAKAYSGLSDEEIRRVDAFVRRNTLERFGPVRAVKPELVFEIGFEGAGPSPRHKSGIAVRFPRMLRWREDKRAADADSIETLRGLVRMRPNAGDPVKGASAE